MKNIEKQRAEIKKMYLKQLHDCVEMLEILQKNIFETNDVKQSISGELYHTVHKLCGTSGNLVTLR